MVFLGQLDLCRKQKRIYLTKLMIKRVDVDFLNNIFGRILTVQFNTMQKYLVLIHVARQSSSSIFSFRVNSSQNISKTAEYAISKPTLSKQAKNDYWNHPSLKKQIGNSYLLILIDIKQIDQQYCKIQMWDSLLTEQSKPNKSVQLTEQQQRKSIAEDKRLGKKTNFPKRWLVNALLIILTTFEVVIIVHSQVYLHKQLLRSFLNFYADRQVYPQLFQGQAFYLYIRQIEELQTNINFIFEKINNVKNDTLVDMNYKKSNMSLQVQYHPKLHEQKHSSVFPIDPQIGIVNPFNASDISQLKQFLLDVHYFQIVVQNLQIQNDGLFERYVHRIIYHYDFGGQIQVRYQFYISNQLSSSIQIQRPQARYYILLRVFYFIILLLALCSFYMNGSYIRTIFKQFYNSVQDYSVPGSPIKNASGQNIFEKDDEKQRRKKVRRSFGQHQHKQMSEKQVQQMHQTIDLNIKVRNITLHTLTWKDYIKIIQIQVLFNVLANILQIIGNIYLLFGRQHEVVTGVACLFSWITVFQQLKNYKRLILMYVLIKISLFAVLQFLVSFLIILMGYTSLALCLFPKVREYYSLSRAVTTLASMMAGDSISQITMAMAEKANTIIVIIFIFSYILLFMHAIHNTLISILKQFYVVKKIQLLKQQKKQKGQQKWMYLEQCQRQVDEEMKKYPVKLSKQVMCQVVVADKLKLVNKQERKVRKLIMLMQNCLVKEKWQVYDYNLHQSQQFVQILQKRLQKIGQVRQQ